ncbi:MULTISPECIES: hypothetical protein [unclassified Acinetobacter]|uniref:hypothetical protein n=1 Tax=unclassified Acinetobacter TaxID=196816 RepID=UPI0015D22793|nr:MULTISPECIES: hypothetical protein [unclassified Acinetobacter]UUS62515.1 hypothetical protein MST17_16815 [Acinetobacter sp. YH16056_T]
MSEFELPEQTRITIKEQPTSRPFNPSAAAIVILFILSIVLWNFISNWENQTSSARYLLAFYDYVIVKPLSIIPQFYEYCRTLELTPYNNLNWFMAIVCIGLYLFVFIPFVIKTILNIMKKIKLYDHRWKIFFTPALLYIFFHFSMWLFK